MVRHVVATDTLLWLSGVLISVLLLVTACEPSTLTLPQQPVTPMGNTPTRAPTNVPTLSWWAQPTFAIAIERAAPGVTPEASTEYCLGCHAPFEKVIQATTDYVVPGENLRINPHMYVPHDTDAIADCSHCHRLHPVPLASKRDVPVANIGYCYNMCHHKQVLQPCPVCLP